MRYRLLGSGRPIGICGAAWMRVVFFGYALFGFLLVPALVSHYVPQWVRENLGAESTLGVTRFNPFLFRLIPSG